jgi:hypothetical protein
MTVNYQRNRIVSTANANNSSAHLLEETFLTCLLPVAGALHLKERFHTPNIVML